MKTKHTIQRQILAIVVILLFSMSAYSQNKLQQAQALKMRYDYAQAINMYTDYFKTATPAVPDIRDLIECYMMINDTKSAETWYAQLISKGGYTAGDLLHYGDILKSNGKYEEAKSQFQSFAAMSPTGKDTADAEILSCNNALAWMADPAYFTVTNATAFNSENSDFGAIKFNDGYIFTSDRKLPQKDYSGNEIFGWTGQPYYKLYFISGVNSSNPVIEPELMSGLNANYQNGAAVYDAKDNIIYFTRTKMVKASMGPLNSDPTSWYDHSSVRDFVNRWEIFSARYSNGRWEDIKAFDYNNAKKFSVGHPAISSDGQTLYFVSDMPGGYGKTDIYYCTKLPDGTWAKPVNAGSKINTAGRESFPYVDQDGKLYFSSDGLPGMGGLDIFSAEGSENNWSDPVNLGYPLNSSKDDFSIYFTEAGTTGYLSSDRNGGKGSDDIYSFKPEARILILAGTTKEMHPDKTSSALSGVNVLLGDSTKGDKKLLTSDENGRFYSILDCGDTYQVNGTLDGYTSQSKDIVATICKTRHDTVYVDLDLKKNTIYLVAIAKEKMPDGTLTAFSGVNILITNTTLKTNNPSLVTNKSGRATSKLDCSSDYTVTAAIEGYLSQSKDLTAICKNESDTVFVEFDMDKIVLNKPIVLNNIYYDFDKWNIRPDAALELDKLVNILRLNPQINIELGSHTDSRGAAAYNDALSQRRADAAVAYIVSKGIDAGRMTAKGYGEKVPVNKCVDGVSCTDEEYQMNRRTEFKVTSIKHGVY